MSNRLNLTIDSYATFEHTVTWTDPSGNPIDMTGYRIRMQFRQDVSSLTTLLDFDSDNLAAGMSISGLDSTGVFTITISDSVTGGLDFTGGEYDLTATSPTGTVYRLHQGKVSVSPGVTR